MTRTRRSCPTCGASLAEHIHRLGLRTPDGHPFNDGYDVVACLFCGTGFADVDIAQHYYDNYYAKQAKYAAEASTATPTTSAAEPAWKAVRLDQAASLIASVLPDKRSSVLDIGCANGTLLGALREQGYCDLRGIDPSKSSAAMAQAHHGVRVDVGTFSNLPPDLGAYDCICITGVLEHVLDIDDAMSVLVGLLRPGGIIYLDVPDASRYLQPYVSPFEDFSTEHVNHFSPQTLEMLGHRFGLATIRGERFVTELAAGVPCAAIRLIWQRGTGRCPTDELVRDEELVDSLKAFTGRSLADFAEIEVQLEASLADRDEYAVWGIGEYTLKLLASDPLVRRAGVALVDGNAARHGMSFGGMKVRCPETLTGLNNQVPLIIGSRLSESSIRAAIGQMRLRNEVLSV